VTSQDSLFHLSCLYESFVTLQSGYRRKQVVTDVTDITARAVHFSRSREPGCATLWVSLKSLSLRDRESVALSAVESV
jgi:hypothetical protein